MRPHYLGGILGNTYKYQLMVKGGRKQSNSEMDGLGGRLVETHSPCHVAIKTEHGIKSRDQCTKALDGC